MDAELAWIARAVGATTARRGERVQSLWSGYGEIFRVHLSGGGARSAVVKWVKPPAGKRAVSDASHRRKCRSYEVETTWYRAFASRCDRSCRVPTLFASKATQEEWLFVLEDLDAAGFAIRRRDLDPGELDSCLRWLAAFHACFLGVTPDGLWKEGTYWHLATRPDELAAVEDRRLREAAPTLDRRLRECVFRTLVHGDAKPANFCFAQGGSAVAAVDFQYVGGGCGMRDVAYLLYDSSCADPAAHAQRHLDAYFGYLRAELGRRRRSLDVGLLEGEWRALYPIAYSDFCRFLAGWAKEQWRHDVHAQRFVRDVLLTLA
jgi:aminoglycoside phosphotransferase (APT) family kinase protein